MKPKQRERLKDDCTYHFVHQLLGLFLNNFQVFCGGKKAVSEQCLKCLLTIDGQMLLLSCKGVRVQAAVLF